MANYRIHWQSNYAMNMDGEYYPIAGYFANHKEGKYRFHFNIRPSYKSWEIWGYLNLQTYCTNDVPLFAKQFRLLRDCKQFADEYVGSEPDFMDKVEEWKALNIKPAFDKDFNFLGNYYSSPSHLTKEYDYQLWDWYSNDTVPLDKRYHVKYTLNRMRDLSGEYYTNVVTIWDINSLGHSARSEKDEQLINKLLCKLDKNKYKRFFENC